jgi:hypothetical protein
MTGGREVFAMVDYTSGLIGLGILSGTNGLGDYAAPAIETRAQRKAKAAFTTAPTAAPWKEKPVTTPVSAQITAIKGMRTVVDKAVTGTAALPQDVQTSFIAYKALDRLRVLAESAAKDTTGSAERASLQKSFAKGLADLQTFLSTAPSDLVDIAFTKTARQVQTVGIKSTASTTAATITGTGVRATRDGALAGVAGNEKLRITLSQPGADADIVEVDLSTTPQPPTLDSVSDAVNAAIAAVPKRDASGDPVIGTDGKPEPRWPSVKMVPAKTGEKWGLSIQRAGFETVAIDQVGGKDALMVAGDVTPKDGKTATRITRLDDPAGALDRRTFDTISAVDRAATERQKIAAEADPKKVKATTVAADTRSNAIATDAQGFSYVVGTSAGDVGANRSDGQDDLLLTKVNSEGKVVWSRTLGAGGRAEGAAVTVAPDGGIVVAGSIKGTLDGNSSDGDMLVVRFDANGDETFSTAVRALGTETANAVAVGADGAIYVGGRSGTGGGDAYLARLDATGKLVERRTIDSGGNDQVKALAFGGDGKLLVLTGENGAAKLRRIDPAALSTDLATLDLGRADARAIAVAADGSIAVAGATETALTGTGTNGLAGSRDGFVARIDAGLADARITYVGTAGEDQVDSVAFLDGSIYLGGRTTGTIGTDKKTGSTDAFVARIDAGTGAVADTRQFGNFDAASGGVRLSAIEGGGGVLGALGLHRGTLTPTDSVKLEAQTSLRAGDEFSIRVNGGALRKITITEKDTLSSFTNRVRELVGNRVATVTMPSKDGGRSLRIDVKPGNEIQLIAGSGDKDALAKLGLDARRISAAPTLSDDAPKVRPGGSFGLDLSTSLRLDTKTEAANSLARVKQAISFTQSAYRSLYWDDTKAQMVDTPTKNGRKAGSTVVQQAQLKNYQAALDRLSGGTTFTGF